MELSRAESAVLARFAEKCRAAGGPQAGQQVRRATLSSSAGRGSGLDLDGALGALLAKGLLKANEATDRYFLTEAGAELLKSLPASLR